MDIAIDKVGKRIFAYNAKSNDDYLCPTCGGINGWGVGGINERISFVSYCVFILKV